MSGSQQYDFVVLGAGLGGMAAAIRAHDLGLKTIVLEKSDQLGGVAAYSSGILWCPGNHLAKREGIADSWEEEDMDFQAFGGGTQDDALLETLCSTAPEAFEYYDKHAGVRWNIFSDPDSRWPEFPGSKERGRYIELEPFDANELPDELRPIVRQSIQTDLFTNEEVYWKMGGRAHKHEWDPALGEERRQLGIRYQGFALAAYFVMAVHDRKIPMYTNVEVKEVTSEAGKVTGVSACINGEDQQVLSSKGVMVAMGGYDWNPELIERFDKRVIIGSTAPRSVTGDHFYLLEHLRPGIFSFPRQAGTGYVEPAGYKGDTKERYSHVWASFPRTITVNEAGQRFGAEDGVAEAGNTSTGERMFDDDGQPLNWPAFVIFDNAYRNKYMVGRTRPGEPLLDCFVSAPTVAELAQKLGINPQGLEDTVTRFNEGAREGRDPEFGRGENPYAGIHQGDVFEEGAYRSLGPLDEAPYFGLRLIPTSGASLTATGLVTDDQARVLDENGDVIENLYATGNTSAYRDVGRYYHSGSANMRNMTWGYVAATHAAND